MKYGEKRRLVGDIMNWLYEDSNRFYTMGEGWGSDLFIYTNMFDHTCVSMFMKTVDDELIFITDSIKAGKVSAGSMCLIIDGEEYPKNYIKKTEDEEVTVNDELIYFVYEFEYGTAGHFMEQVIDTLILDFHKWYGMNENEALKAVGIEPSQIKFKVSDIEAFNDPKLIIAYISKYRYARNDSFGRNDCIIKGDRYEKEIIKMYKAVIKRIKELVESEEE